MSPVIPFRPRSTVPIAVWIVAGAVLAFAATYIFLEWQGSPSPTKSHRVQIIGPAPSEFGPIEVIDGDTVRLQGVVYRLSGFDTPERGDKARCDDERRRAEAATKRLRSLVANGETSFKRVPCACRQGKEGTRPCNYGRLCGSVTISGEDVGHILISEGLARSYVCNATSCPKRRPWCDER
jgi:endonuclease YncB( thermonuclease family)